MNLINLPSAALPQSAGAAASSALPLDLAMLDSGVPEELFAALLAGQLQAVTAVTGESLEASAQPSELPTDSVVSDIAAMLQSPQPQADLSVLLASAARQPTAIAVMPEMVGQAEPGLSELIPSVTTDSIPEQADPGFNSADPRQAFAAPAAAFAISSTASGPVADFDGTTRSLAQDAQYGVAMRTPAAVAALPQTEAEAGVSGQSQGTITFALPQMQQSAALTTQVQTSPAVQTSIPQQVGSQAWGGMVGERVVWMFGQQHQSADIMLNPPSLGPLEVRLSMSDGQANLTFTTQHAPVREALEAATPRLREMLTESGIGLGNVSVNVGNFSRQDPQGQQQANPGAPSNWIEPGDARDFTVMTTELTGRKNNGLLDLFA